MFPILHLGPLAIQIPGLLLLLGIGIGLSLAEKKAEQHRVNGGFLYNMVLGALISGGIGARLAYVIQHPTAFIVDPASLISLSLGLIDPIWGIFLGIGTAGIIIWHKKLPLWSTLDSLTIALGVFAIAFHLANFASGNAYGSPSNLPWAIELWGTHRHPVQIYETLAAIIILWFIWPRQGWINTPGHHFLVFIAMSAGTRLLLEALHGNSMFWEGFRVAQLIAWLILAVCLWGMAKIQVSYGK